MVENSNEGFVRKCPVVGPFSTEWKIIVNQLADTAKLIRQTGCYGIGNSEKNNNKVQGRKEESYFVTLGPLHDPWYSVNKEQGRDLWARI